MKNWKIMIGALILAGLLGTVAWAVMPLKSGCCSHHGGVAGCDVLSGMQRCNDGTLSPSCKCGE